MQLQATQFSKQVKMRNQRKKATNQSTYPAQIVNMSEFYIPTKLSKRLQTYMFTLAS